MRADIALTEGASAVRRPSVRRLVRIARLTRVAVALVPPRDQVRNAGDEGGVLRERILGNPGIGHAERWAASSGEEDESAEEVDDGDCERGEGRARGREREGRWEGEPQGKSGAENGTT